MCKALEELMAEELAECKRLGLEQGVKQGVEQGVAQGLEQGVETGIRAFIEDNIEEHIPKDRTLQKLVKRFDLTLEKAEEYYHRFGA